MAIQDVSVSMVAKLSASINTSHFINVPVSIIGELLSEVGIQQLTDSGPISMTGSLDSTVDRQILTNVSVEMLGELTAEVEMKNSLVDNDFFVDFEEDVIYAKGVNMATLNIPHTRTRGDTYPISAVLAIKGNYDTSGITIVMSTRIGNGAIYQIPATVLDSASGLVEFPISLEAVSTVGAGTYDIQGDDGSYIYTYQKGTFTLENDLTV